MLYIYYYRCERLSADYIKNKFNAEEKMKMQTRKTKLVARVFAVVMLVAMLFSMATMASAAANEEVNAAKSGVVQVQVWFNDPESANEVYLQYGSGFLVNDTTVVTCSHVVEGFTDDFYVQWAQKTNAELGLQRTAADIKEHLELRVIVYRDVFVKATVKNSSNQMDYAILTLEQPITGRDPLALRDTATLQQTEEVFALGYPGDLDDLSVKHEYDTASVSISSGKVNKVGDMSFATVQGNSFDNVNCVESSAQIAAGNSGGPLVDADGNVVGINAAGNDTRNIAVSISQVMTVLDALGIDYVKPGETLGGDDTETGDGEETPVLNTAGLTAAIADAKAKADAKDTYTEESYQDLEDAIEGAETALTASTQAEIDAAEAALKSAVSGLDLKPKKDNTMLIVIIAIAAVVVIGVVVVLIVVLGKKKPAPAPAPQPAPARPAPQPPVPPAQRPVAPAPPRPAPAPVPQPANETTVLNQGAGETTVLGQGAGETTVLSQNVNGGTLVRVSNNERISINTADFTVGRERTKVDYCVSGNSNISRIHVRFIVRNGVTYLVDNKAANGTFINGIKANPGQELQLKSGDKIVLADEKFEFIK